MTKYYYYNEEYDDREDIYDDVMSDDYRMEKLICSAVRDFNPMDIYKELWRLDSPLAEDILELVYHYIDLEIEEEKEE